MELEVQNIPNAAHTDSSNLPSSTDIIDAMIELRGKRQEKPMDEFGLAE